MRPCRYLDFRPLASRTMRKCTSVKPPGTPGHHISAVPGAETWHEEGMGEAGRVTARAWLDLRASRAPTLDPGSEDKQEMARRDRQRPPAPRSGCFPRREQPCQPGTMSQHLSDGMTQQSCLPWPTFPIRFSAISIFSTCCAAVIVINAAYNIPPRRCTGVSLTLLPASVKSFQMFKGGII